MVGSSSGFTVRKNPKQRHIIVETRNESCYNLSIERPEGGEVLLPYLQSTAQGVILRIRLQPRSSKNAIAGVMDGCLKVRVNAPPVEGAANEACQNLLAKLFGIAKGRVRIISGSTSRQKQVLLQGLEEQFVRSHISELLQESQSEVSKGLKP